MAAGEVASAVAVLSEPGHPAAFLFDLDQPTTQVYMSLPGLAEISSDPRVVHSGEESFSLGVYHWTIGTEHRFDPIQGNWYWESTDYGFRRWVLLTDGRPRIEILEGNDRTPSVQYIGQHPDLTPEEAYTRTSEVGLAAWYAARHNIDVLSTEPDPMELLAFLRELRLPDEAIGAYFLARNVPVYQGKWATAIKEWAIRPPTFQEYFESLGNEMGMLKQLGFTYEQVLEFFARQYPGISFDPTDEKLAAMMRRETIAYMDQPTTMVAAVSRAVNFCRDAWLKVSIQELSRRGIASITVVGLQHVLAIRRLDRAYIPVRMAEICLAFLDMRLQQAAKLFGSSVVKEATS